MFPDSLALKRIVRDYEIFSSVPIAYLRPRTTVSSNRAVDASRVRTTGEFSDGHSSHVSGTGGRQVRSQRQAPGNRRRRK